MKIATWNVNSVRARLERVLEWLREHQPDVLCLQETKVVDDAFPTEEFLRLGYAVAMSGQKTYNGVAIASRLPLQQLRVGLDDDTATSERRYLAATIDGVRVVSVYVPNGKDVELPAFRDKLAWLARLRQTLGRELSEGAALALCGDFNIAPDERDVYSVEALRGKLHFHPEEHRALQALQALGLRDAFRLHDPAGERFSWWDYRGGAFQRNQGLRIDLILLSDALARRSRRCTMDVAARTKDKPSDHIPVMVELGPSP